MSTLPGPTATHQHTGEQPQRKRRRAGWKPLLAIIGGVVAVAVAASAVLIWFNLRHPGLPEIPETPYEVHGSSEVVRYIAAHLVNHETVIDITAFYQEPELRFIDHFRAFEEANAQNPLVLDAYVVGDSVHTPDDAVWPEDSRYFPAPDRVILEIQYGEPSAEKYAANQEELKRAADDALTELGIDGRSDAEKATAINDWVIDHAIYDHASAAIQHDNVYGGGSGTGAVAWGSRDARGVFFTGTAMCGGYADAFLLLAHEAGLEAVTVTGTIVLSDMDHAWNRVRVDGEWLSLDPTWNDDDKEGRQRNQYLLLSEPDGYTGKAERVPDGNWVRKASRDLYETGR